ncbi:MAG: CBS domain-containing protein [Planctomycetes bacterium]|nr:CBS domain-containing protein [Planctomycetota bacterium]
MASKDFSRTINNGQSTSDIAVLERNEAGKAKDIAKYGVITIEKDKSVYDAIRKLVEKNISGLPVVDDTGLAGIISEKDVLRLLYDNKALQGSVGDYMTGEVISFDEEENLADICDCLMNNNFRRVPIMHQDKLVGIISRADLIKANKDKFKPQGLVEKSIKHKEDFLAKDVMKCGLLTVQKHMPIYEAMEILATRNITGLPVIDDSMNLVGIVSEKDILKLLYDPKAEPGKVEDFMTKEVVSFNHDDSLHDVCDCLMYNYFRRVPILKHGKLAGVISRADLIIYILKNESALFKGRHTG